MIDCVYRTTAVALLRASYGYQAEQYLRGRYFPMKQVHNVKVPICPDSLMHEKPSG